MPTVGVFGALFDDQGRLLLVKQGYGREYWQLPGGRMEAGEAIPGALVREVYEETGYTVEVGRLIGVYSQAPRDDLALFFEVSATGHGPWQPNGEIVETRFVHRDELPDHTHPWIRQRMEDAFDVHRGFLHVFDTDPSPP